MIVSACVMVAILQGRDAATITATPVNVTLILGRNIVKQRGYKVIIDLSRSPGAAADEANWGGDHRSRCKNLQVFYRGREVPVPRSGFADLTDLSGLEINESGGKWFARLNGGDTATAYYGQLVFKKGVLVSRVVKGAEFPDQAYESTVYTTRRSGVPDSQKQDKDLVSSDSVVRNSGRYRVRFSLSHSSAASLCKGSVYGCSTRKSASLNKIQVTYGSEQISCDRSAYADLYDIQALSLSSKDSYCEIVIRGGHRYEAYVSTITLHNGFVIKRIAQGSIGTQVTQYVKNFPKDM